MKKPMLTSYCHMMFPEEQKLFSKIIKHCSDAIDFFGLYYISSPAEREEMEKILKKEGLLLLVLIFEKTIAEGEATREAFDDMMAKFVFDEIRLDDPETLQVIHDFAASCLRLPHLFRYVEATELYDPSCNMEYFIAAASKRIHDEIDYVLDPQWNGTVVNAAYKLVFFSAFDIFTSQLAKRGVYLGSVNHERVFYMKDTDDHKLAHIREVLGNETQAETCACVFTNESDAVTACKLAPLFVGEAT